ncbi:MAG: helix-turn-helix domain-containing protein [Roseovarius sp.]
MQRVSVTILVEPGFIATELALVQDVLRIANRLSPTLLFDVGICTAGETGLIEGTGGILVRAESLQRDRMPLSDHLVVLGGKGNRARFEKLRPWLRWCERMGQKIILLSDAAFEWQRPKHDPDGVTMHWEDHQVNVAAICETRGNLPLFCVQGRVTTAAGMVSCADVVLSLVITPLSTSLAQAVANILLMERVRSGTSEQPRSENDVNALRVVNLETAIAKMEANIEEPLPMSELSVIAGVSVRQFERKFKRFLGQTPAAFYRSLRLRHARALIEQTAMSVSEIALSSGFASTSTLAKHFMREFGTTPARYRARLLATDKLARLETQTQGPNDAPFSFPARSPRPSAHSSGTDEALIQRAGR